MASCLSYPILNPSRPGERLKAVPWHLLAISLKSPREEKKIKKANNPKVSCFASETEATGFMYLQISNLQLKLGFPLRC